MVKFERDDKVVVIGHSRCECYAPIGMLGTIISSNIEIVNKQRLISYQVEFNGYIVDPWTHKRKPYDDYVQRLAEKDLIKLEVIKKDKLYKCMKCFKEFKGNKIKDYKCPECMEQYKLMEVFDI